jgi:predicted transcriptional regulator of viral defense system
MSVFSINDATKILRKPREYTWLFLSRCIKQNKLGKAERGVYYLKERSNEYEIASGIVTPSYISLVSALAYYGLTTQIPNTVYVVSTKRHRAVKGAMGYDIVFKHIAKGMMFGYHKEASGNISVADPEKAIVDIYYFNDVNDLDETMLDKPSRIDVGRLAEYALRSGRKTVISRTAELLDEHGYKKEARLLSQAGMAK